MMDQLTIFQIAFVATAGLALLSAGFYLYHLPGRQLDHILPVCWRYCATRRKFRAFVQWMLIPCYLHGVVSIMWFYWDDVPVLPDLDLLVFIGRWATVSALFVIWLGAVGVWLECAARAYLVLRKMAMIRQESHFEP